ncbi:MAG: T9SS type A sorting domain-containing protein [Candidatus Kapaibacterium sp.]
MAALLVIIITIGTAEFCYSQWSRLHHLPAGITLVEAVPPSAPNEKNIVLASYSDSHPLFADGMDISSDAGVTWWSVHPGLQGATSGVFLDRLNGWVVDPGQPGIAYKTTDGGINWDKVIIDTLWAIGYWGTYFNPASGRLYFGGDGDYAWTDNNGATFHEPLPQYSLAFMGFAFKDANVGIGASMYGKQLYTLDGGDTWNYALNGPDAFFTYTPALMPDSNTFVVAATQDTGHVSLVWISQDSGKTWRVTGKLPTEYFTGQLLQSNGILYANDDDGVTESKDTGHTWIPLCSPPAHNLCNTLAAANGTIYSGDAYGDLWINRSGLPNGPRLVFDSNYSVVAGAVISVPLRTPHSFYAGFTADSVNITLKFNTNALSEKSISLAPGWSISQIVQDTDGIVLHLVRATANIETDSTLATINFQTYLSPDLHPTVSLDEINWDNDTTFRDCMVSALSSTDTAHINLLLACGDSTILAAMEHAPPFSIESIVPNPATATLRVEGRGQRVEGELVDALGRTVVPSALYTLPFTLDVRQLPSGIYFLRFSQKGYVQSRHVSIEH